jgi:hypothetical protein
LEWTISLLDRVTKPNRQALGTDFLLSGQAPNLYLPNLIEKIYLTYKQSFDHGYIVGATG